jgi:AraC-like DNA-binding protein
MVRIPLSILKNHGIFWNIFAKPLKSIDDTFDFTGADATRFMERIRPGDFFVDLIERIPGVNFFMKDLEGRIVHCDNGFVEMLGCQSRDEVLGYRDPKFFPPHIATVFMEGDKRVISTGEPLLDQFELVARKDFQLDWYVTHKYPVKDARGEIIGVAGINSLVQGSRRGPFSDKRLNRAMEHIRQHYPQSLPVPVLAECAGMSRRSFERLFQKELNCSPNVYLKQVRVNAVCRILLDTRLSLAEVAAGCGFADQSHMTREFRKLIGVTPRTYRQKRTQD